MGSTIPPRLGARGRKTAMTNHPNRMTPRRREYLFALFLAAGFEVKTLNQRNDVFLAKVRRIDGAANASYAFGHFRLTHDQYNGDRIVTLEFPMKVA